MGQPVAPIIAILYVAYYERLLLSTFKDNLRLYKRYFDDILINWIPSTDPFAWNHFLAFLRSKFPGLKFTMSKPLHKVQFLDLEFFPVNSKLRIYTFEKVLNLYLYTTFNSAHPHSTRKGLITGMLHRFKNQCTHREDYFRLAQNFFTKLQNRGFQKTG